jgi:hypothetical protein
MVDVVEARARALGAERAIERRDIILAVMCVIILREGFRTKEGESWLQLMPGEEVDGYGKMSFEPSKVNEASAQAPKLWKKMACTGHGGGPIMEDRGRNVTDAKPRPELFEIHNSLTRREQHQKVNVVLTG